MLSIMKRLLSILFATMLTVQTYAGGEFVVGNLKYTITGGNTVSVSSKNNQINGAIVIPETIEKKRVTYHVTSIEDKAFKGCYGIVSVTIPNSIISIGNSAFQYCNNLISVTIPSSVTSIASQAFYGCKKLTSITIPNSVKNIGSGAFYGCNATINCVARFTPSGWHYIWNYGHTGKVIWGAVWVETPTNKETITKLPNKLPRLDIVQKTMLFVDESDNNAIDANESCKIQFDIKNSGQGDGFNCIAKISIYKGSSKGLQFSSIKLPTIKAGKTQHVEIPIRAGNNVENGTVVMSIEIVEPNGFGSDPVQLTVNTKAFEAPLVQVVDYTVTGSNGTTIAKREEFNLQLLLQNTKYGKAENVNVKIELPANVFMMIGEQQTNFSILKAGEQQILSYSLIVNNNYSSAEIPIKVLITEKYGKYAENKTITLKMNQTLASNA